MKTSASNGLQQGKFSVLLDNSLFLSDLPESCVGGSSWLISGEGLRNSGSQHDNLLQSPIMSSTAIDGKSAGWSGINDSYLNRKRGSAASDVISSRTASTWADHDSEFFLNLSNNFFNINLILCTKKE
jgi:hypothetical protein